MQFISIVPGDKKEDPPKCSVTPEARAYLSQLHTPIAVVSCAGPFRCHKSWLMSHMTDPSGQTQEFSTSPSVRPHTHGLWIASKFIDKTKVLLVDTEGLNAPNSTDQLDTTILACSILLSTKLIFCTKGRIDSTAFDSLQSAIVMARWFSNKYASSDETKSEHEFLVSRPQLTWIIRDMALQLLDANKKPITASQYLEEALESANPELRNSLQQLFVSRTLVPMVYPVKHDHELEDMRIQNLTPAFKRDIQIVKANICDSQPKKINGQDMTGLVLLSMADALCTILSKGGMPSLTPIWKSATLAINAEIRHQIVQSFTASLHDQFTVEPQLCFWSTQEMQNQMINALKTWASKQTLCDANDAILMVESCWQSIQTASLAKFEIWKANMVKNANDVAHLLPMPMREAVVPIFAKCAQLEQEIVIFKTQVEDAQAAMEHLRSTQHSSLGSALSNEEELRVSKQELQHTKTELEEVIAAHATFREATVERQKALKQSVVEHKLEAQAWQDKELQLTKEITQLTKRIEETLREKQAASTECNTLRQTAKDAQTLIATETRKRSASEAKLMGLETEVNFLKQNKVQLDSNLASLTSEQHKLKMDNFKFQCLLEMRGV